MDYLKLQELPALDPRGTNGKLAMSADSALAQQRAKHATKKK